MNRSRGSALTEAPRRPRIRRSHSSPTYSRRDECFEGGALVRRRPCRRVRCHGSHHADEINGTIASASRGVDARPIEGDDSITPAANRQLCHTADAPWRYRPWPLKAWRGRSSGYQASEFSETNRSLATLADTLGSRLYEGGRLVNPLCQIADNPKCRLPGERCRVKRLSKVTGVNMFGSWRLTRQCEPGRKLTVHGPRAGRAVGAVLISLSPHHTSRTRCHRGSLRWRSS